MTLCMSYFSVLLIRNECYFNYYLFILLRISVFIFLFTSRIICIGIALFLLKMSINRSSLKKKYTVSTHSIRRFKLLPGTTPLVAMALIDMAVSIVCRGKGKIWLTLIKKGPTCRRHGKLWALEIYHSFHLWQRTPKHLPCVAWNSVKAQLIWYVRIR